MPAWNLSSGYITLFNVILSGFMPVFVIFPVTTSPPPAGLCWMEVSVTKLFSFVLAGFKQARVLWKWVSYIDVVSDCVVLIVLREPLDKRRQNMDRHRLAGRERCMWACTYTHTYTCASMHTHMHSLSLWRSFVGVVQCVPQCNQQTRTTEAQVRQTSQITTLA